MMLDMGFPITTAMQDAMDEMKFQQVTNLFQKVPNNKEMGSNTNEEGMNLFHIFAKKAGGSNIDKLILGIYRELKNREVDPTVQDNFGMTALDYACQSGGSWLVNALLDHYEFDLNEETSGYSKLCYLVKSLGIHSIVQWKINEKENVAQVQPFGADNDFTKYLGKDFRKDPVEMLISKGASVNFLQQKEPVNEFEEDRELRYPPLFSLLQAIMN